MIFGGLEFVAGGYLIHRHYRKKSEKEKLEEEAQKRRHHTFPGANCTSNPSGWNTQAQHRPQFHQQQQPVIPQQKYAVYTQPTTQPRPQCQQQCQSTVQQAPRPTPPANTKSFTIPRRPVPERKPQIIIQPISLQRTDSFATISRMPIANGSRPQDVPDEPSSMSPPRNVTGLSLAPQHGVYGNAGFSVSTPAFGATPTSPPVSYTIATGAGRGDAVDDNWETYESGNRLSYAPTVSTQLGEQDPPPPYKP